MFREDASYLQEIRVRIHAKAELSEATNSSFTLNQLQQLVLSWKIYLLKDLWFCIFQTQSHLDGSRKNCYEAL